MTTETTRITIRVPREHLEAARAYARRHGITVSEVINRYLRALHGARTKPSKTVAEITGLVPSNIDANSTHRDHTLVKHSR